MQNQHPKSWDEAAQWLKEGELESYWKGEWGTTGKIEICVDEPTLLTEYRRRPAPVKPREVRVYLNESNYCLVAYGSSEAGFATKKELPLFREVVEMPELTEGEACAIFNAWKAHYDQRPYLRGRDTVRFVYTELKKMGRAQ